MVPNLLGQLKWLGPNSLINGTTSGRTGIKT